MELRSKLITNFPNYLVYENGDIFSVKSEKLLIPVLSNHYLTVRLYNESKEFKNFRVHKIVIEHFGENSIKSNWIKHLDNNKQNNHYTNLVYCEFKELLNGNKTRKKTRKKSIYSYSTLNKVEAYKYYFQNIPSKEVKAVIITLRSFADSVVIKKRWVNKKKLTEAERIFKQYCQGSSYKQLVTTFNVSYYQIKKAIIETRSNLIREILSDVESNMITYSPIEPKRGRKALKSSFTKDALLYWEKYKIKLQK